MLKSSILLTDLQTKACQDGLNPVMRSYNSNLKIKVDHRRSIRGGKRKMETISKEYTTLFSQTPGNNRWYINEGNVMHDNIKPRSQEHSRGPKHLECQEMSSLVISKAGSHYPAQEDSAMPPDPVKSGCHNTPLPLFIPMDLDLKTCS